MNVRVLAFARLRELLGSADIALVVAADSTAERVWAALAAQTPALVPLAASTRFACNGKLVARDAILRDGDELALLPPVGGG